ncbi:hypothetical protein JIG36_35485 [Actinoplanes sp. LDG1-06]|uniref:Uncharacterized protein n=1 Tax=Paractinoplanes ovalisporus TaxID=2810368 RepID=A0ABS2ALV9_9ACTN|nr:hypothetical protein [Actinoplanes ovalisporus]MBM2620816.1 hypothetical protein [Actinoplanes ovalisporus]
MEAEDAVVLLAAAPATAYREYLYRPGGRLARWIDDRFEVLARPGLPVRRPPRAGDVLLEVRLGAGSGRCRTLGPGEAGPGRSNDGLPPGQLLLRPRRPTTVTEPQAVEPATVLEHAFGDDEAGPPAPAPVDTAAAVPPFAAAERSALARPLLSARQSAEAVAWTRRMHPAVSGVGPDDLRARLREYVDEAVVAAAVRGDADAVLVESVHQFQIKCYRDPREHDGRAGESTLDSLGLVIRAGTGFRGADRGNARALQRLRNLKAGAFTDGLTAASWFDAMADPSVFGRRTVGGAGLHLLLVRRLREAERYLLSLPAYQGKTPAALGAALGITEPHGGARPGQATSGSVHTFGLAIDIGYLANPWINHDTSWTALKNAANLVSGTRLTARTVTAYFAALGESGRPTGDIWDELHRLSAELVTYLRLADDPAALRAALRPGLTQPGETPDAAVERWRSQIRRDRERLVANDFSHGRRPENGFLKLPRDLVVALRDRACLAWGAVDFGPSADGSGDMMHFDARIGGVGEALARGVNYVPPRGHPCLTARPATPVGTVAPTEKTAEHAGGRLWTFVPDGYGLPVAVYCPPAALTAPDVEILLFAHGLLDGCPRPRNVPAGFVTDQPFALGPIVAASGRPMVLVVPLLDWRRPGGEDVFGRGHELWHALAAPARFDALIGEVMAQVGRVRGSAAPGAASLVVAGHSRAYDFLDPLAADHRRHNGALLKLTEVWAFDTTYGKRVEPWVEWLTANPSLRVRVFYRPGSPHRSSRTAAGGEAFARHAGPRLTVTPVTEEHCDIPAARLRELLPATHAEQTSETWEAEDAPPSAQELTTRIVRSIGVWETNRGGRQPMPRESELDTVAAVPASMATVEQATIPYAITVLRRHKALRDQAQPPLTLKELNAADARVTAVKELLDAVAVASSDGVTPDAFIAAHGPAVNATGLSHDDVRTMFRAEILRETLSVARAERNAAGRAARAGAVAEKKPAREQKAAADAARQRSVVASVAGIPEYDRLGLGSGSLTSYVNSPSKWGENAAGWARRAVRAMPGDVAARIEAVATSDHGQALAVPTVHNRVADELAKTPQPTTEQVVRAVARRNNPNEAGYELNVWKTYQRLYP